jgi:proton-dependent oligopeptide transporter, POT family
MRTGHHKGLYVLTMTEASERFGYYGMRALLVLYLTQGLGFSDADAFALYGNYTALAFVAPLLGGVVADRFLGARAAILTGALIMILGQAGLAGYEFAYGGIAHAVTPAPHGYAAGMQFFYLSLATIIFGVGLLKPNLAQLLGMLYSRDSPQRDSAFTIFYWGINVGGVAAALVCGYIGQAYGWAYGFGAAAVAITVGLVIFVAGSSWLPHDERVTLTPYPNAARVALTFVLAAITVGTGTVLIQSGTSLAYLMAGVFVVSIVAWIRHARKRETRPQQSRTLAALFLLVIWILVAAFLEQEGSSMSLFTQRAVDRVVRVPSFMLSFFGSEPAGSQSKYVSITLRAAQLQATSGIFIILASPALAWLWNTLARLRVSPSAPRKFAWSFLALAACYGTLATATVRANESGLVGLGWLLAAYLGSALAALLSVPVGLAAISRLADPQISGFAMGLWFLANALGNLLSARVAAVSGLSTGAAGSLSAALLSYRSFFEGLAVTSLLLGLIVLAVAPYITRLMEPE